MPPPLQWKRIHICNIFGMPDIITITLIKRNPITNQLPRIRIILSMVLSVDMYIGTQVIMRLTLY